MRLTYSMTACIGLLRSSRATKHFHTQAPLNKIQPSNTKGKKKGSQDWLYRQLNDPYTKKSWTENYRCRSAYKLLEMNEKYKLLKPGDVVVDCGAAPGSWCQVAAQIVNANKQDKSKPKGEVIGVDLQSMIPIDGVTLLNKSDFTHISTQKEILRLLNGRRANVVMSDMAPSASGVKSMDHEIIIELCKSCLKFSVNVLDLGGIFVCKIWQGGMQNELEGLLKHCFKTVNVAKPPSSRSDSAEAFYVAKNFTGIPRPK